MNRTPATARPAPAIRVSAHTSAIRHRRASHPLLAWLTLLAIAGTLCACGRYGPPQRRTPETSTTDAASGSAASPAATTPEYPTEDEYDGEEPGDDDERRDERND